MPRYLVLARKVSISPTMSHTGVLPALVIHMSAKIHRRATFHDSNNESKPHICISESHQNQSRHAICDSEQTWRLPGTSSTQILCPHQKHFENKCLAWASKALGTGLMAQKDVDIRVPADCDGSLWDLFQFLSRTSGWQFRSAFVPVSKLWSARFADKSAARNALPPKTRNFKVVIETTTSAISHKPQHALLFHIFGLR